MKSRQSAPRTTLTMRAAVCVIAMFNVIGVASVQDVDKKDVIAVDTQCDYLAGETAYVGLYDKCTAACDADITAAVRETLIEDYAEAIEAAGLDAGSLALPCACPCWSRKDVRILSAIGSMDSVVTSMQDYTAFTRATWIIGDAELEATTYSRETSGDQPEIVCVIVEGIDVTHRVIDYGQMNACSGLLNE